MKGANALRICGRNLAIIRAFFVVSGNVVVSALAKNIRGATTSSRNASNSGKIILYLVEVTAPCFKAHFKGLTPAVCLNEYSV